MHQRLAGCSFVFPGRSLEDGIRQVAVQGFRWVDVGIGGVNGHLSPIEAARNPEIWASAVGEVAARHGVRLAECFTVNFGWPINDPDPDARKETQTLFSGLAAFAQAAGFRSILLLPG